MTIVSRRMIPFALVLAIAATLAVWMTAGAATPHGGGPSGLSPINFWAVTTSMHYSPNGSTDKKPAGATIQQTKKLLVSGKQIGRAFINGTVINNASWLLLNFEVRFPGRGRIEFQGALPPSGHNNIIPIIGGTGDFTNVHGWLATHKGTGTITFK